MKKLQSLIIGIAVILILLFLGGQQLEAVGWPVPKS